MGKKGEKSVASGQSNNAFRGRIKKAAGGEKGAKVVPILSNFCPIFSNWKQKTSNPCS